MAFHVQDLENWERRTHYEAYTTFLPLNWSITVQLDVTALLPALRAQSLRFYPAMLFAAATAVNQNRAFCMAYNAEGVLGWFDEMHPNYTIFHEDDQTFSDIWTTYHANFSEFYANTIQDMTQWRDAKGYKTKPNRPVNCFPASMTPWLDFTACSFDTFRPAQMLQPIITFGKYHSCADKTVLSVSICASHAVADGWHAACLARDMQHTIDMLAANLAKKS